MFLLIIIWFVSWFVFFPRTFGSAVQLKNIKFTAYPDIKTLIRQIEHVHSEMNTIIRHDGELDLGVTITMIQTDEKTDEKVQTETKPSSTLDSTMNDDTIVFDEGGFGSTETVLVERQVQTDHSSNDFIDDGDLPSTTPSSLSVSRCTSCASLQSLDSVESICSGKSDSSGSSTGQDSVSPMSVTFATTQEKLIIVPDEI